MITDTNLPPNEKYCEISNLIEHPMMVQPPGEPNKPVNIPIMLTTKERKKLRRQRRREAEKEKQEKIQFGLMDKPEPKVCVYVYADVLLMQQIINLYYEGLSVGFYQYDVHVVCL